MTLMETNSTSTSRFENVKKKLAEIFTTESVNGRTVYRISETLYIVPLLFPLPWDGIVIEYNGFDEGRVFGFDDYDSDETLLKDILQEIER